MRPLVAASALLLALPLLPAPSTALPTPGVFCDLAEPVHGRVFPEALASNDYVGFREAECGLRRLAEIAPDTIEMRSVAKSVGWTNTVTQQRDQFDVWVVEVTNEKSNTTFDAKIHLLFQVSIHGNEKGGREGALRVIEDFARGIGMASDAELAKLLDYVVLVFAFTNPDGWVHEEAEYRANDACYFSLTCGSGLPVGGGPGEPGVETQSFVRVNGNGKDMNRNWPTAGWLRAEHTPLSEPEVIGLHAYVKSNLTNVRYATDIHGMLNPADGQFPAGNDVVGPATGATAPQGEGARSHFLLTLLSGGRMDPLEQAKQTSIAERVKEIVNANPAYADWQSLPSTGAWGGEFNEWGTSYDDISYEDSGFTGDFWLQDHGFNAIELDFELSYNHILFDNYYPGLGARVNDYSVNAVRDIVRAFLEEAARDIRFSVETRGLRTAFVENPIVATNVGNLNVTGWAQENPNDDAYDVGHREFEAAANEYFVDLQPFVRDGDAPGVLDALPADDVTPETLARYDNLVVAGSAVDALRTRPSAVAAVVAWTEAGGNLFLTDSALTLLADLGVVGEGGIERSFQYTGQTNIADRSHALVEGVRGLARQTYIAVPLGFAVDGNNAPSWSVAASDFDGDAVGFENLDGARVNLGQARVGEGTVSFLGAMLPDPSTEFYHPYGVESYTVTYTGAAILRNALGWEEKFEAPPAVLENLGEERARELAQQAEAPQEGGSFLPAPGALVAVLALAGAGLVARRR